MQSQVNQLVRALRQRNLTLALAESMTCGLAAHYLAGVKGTSDVFKGGIVCYTPDIKCGVLNVPKRTIQKYTCESMEVTTVLARNTKKLFQSDVSAAITGLASPGGSETKDKPVGTVFLAVNMRGALITQRMTFTGSPLEIKRKTCKALYALIISHVKNR